MSIKFFVCFVLPQLFYHAVDSETIFDYIPREIMPVELGGSEKSLKIIDGRLILFVS